jgi:uncharacterized membrane protein YfcA
MAVGFVSGLLANAGGFLLVPCYTNMLRQPMKKAFACSLAVSCILAMPGTIVHAYLGHISWAVTALVAAGAIPFAHLGARLAIATRAAKLERWYGMTLTALGIFSRSDKDAAAARNLFFGCNPQSLHLPVQMTSLQSQHFGGAGHVAMRFI